MSWLSNLKISKRLGLAFALILSFSVLIASLGVSQLKSVADQTKVMMQIPLTKERLSSDWSRNINSAVVRTTAVARSNDASLSSFFKADAAASAKSSTALMKEIEGLIASEEEKALFAKIGEVRKNYTASRDKVFKLKEEGQAEEANKVLDTAFVPVANQYQSMVGEFLALQRKNLDEETASIAAAEKTSRFQLIALAALSIAIAIACAWLLTVGITRPLKRAVAAARQVADGDLSAQIAVTSKDETGELLQSLADMNRNLLRIVSQVRIGTNTIATASTEISSGNLDLSARTEQQASSLEETAASMEELTTTVKQTADNAKQANQLAISASDVAMKGGKVVSQVVETMGAITESSKKIADIISVIDSIAFQTNILALNAAVEAARAGEQGRGFAVVASEVRTLAQRSAAAAKEIKTLIDDSVDKVEGGSKLVLEAGGTMEEVVQSVRRVTDIMSEIASASHEQSIGIAQVNEAIAQMDEVTQQNAALVEQAAAAAQSMQDQAADLARVVGRFRLDGNAEVSLHIIDAPVERIALTRDAEPKKLTHA